MANTPCFDHPLGHVCDDCEAIRAIGPKPPGNPLSRLAEREHEDAIEATEAEAQARRYEMRQQRKAARKIVLRGRGYLGLAALLTVSRN